MLTCAVLQLVASALLRVLLSLRSFKMEENAAARRFAMKRYGEEKYDEQTDFENPEFEYIY